MNIWEDWVKSKKMTVNTRGLKVRMKYDESGDGENREDGRVTSPESWADDPQKLSHSFKFHD